MAGGVLRYEADDEVKKNPQTKAEVQHKNDCTG
jgi:hypothetical protein